jgi:hypothetical protein
VLAGALVPELLDRNGRPAPFEGGANMGPAARPGRAVSIAAGGTLAATVAAKLRLRPGELAWSGADGLAGVWRLRDEAGPYRLRLRLQPLEPPLREPPVSASAPLPLG